MTKNNTAALKYLFILFLLPTYIFSNVMAQPLEGPEDPEDPESYEHFFFPYVFNMDDEFPWGEEVTFWPFEGAALERIDNPDKSGLNETDFVLKYEKTDGGMPWAGFFYIIEEAMDFEEVHDHVFRLKVWSPRDDIDATLKLEIEGTNIEDQVDIPITVAEEWVQLEWDLADFDAAPWDKIVFFMELAESPGGGEDYTWFMDDFSLLKADDTSSELAGADIPESLQLSQNYPNPFNPTTKIDFALPEAAQVTLEVYNMLGQKVVTLENGHLSAGQHSVSFDASDLSSGIYLYRLQAGNQVLTRSLTLVK